MRVRKRLFCLHTNGKPLHSDVIKANLIMEWLRFSQMNDSTEYMLCRKTMICLFFLLS